MHCGIIKKSWIKYRGRKLVPGALVFADGVVHRRGSTVSPPPLLVWSPAHAADTSPVKVQPAPHSSSWLLQHVLERIRCCAGQVDHRSKQKCGAERASKPWRCTEEEHECYVLWWKKTNMDGVVVCCDSGGPCVGHPLPGTYRMFAVVTNMHFNCGAACASMHSYQMLLSQWAHMCITIAGAACAGMCALLPRLHIKYCRHIGHIHAC